VFCVIIKNTLYSTKACSAHTSFFWLSLSLPHLLDPDLSLRGAIFPYLASWTLYQGDALMKVLNWAGLVINGSVAFILPLILCSYFYYRTAHHCEPDVHDVEMSHTHLPKHLNKTDGPPSLDTSSQQRIEASLPSFLVPYRWWIVHSIIVVFVTMILATVTLDIATGSGPP
jgi:hypothetical protein